MRTIRRPLLNRQMTGAMFGEDAVLVSQTQQINERGVTAVTTRRRPVRLATTPLPRSDARAAVLMQGGTRLEDIREFFTDFSVDITKRDKIVYPAEGGDTYTIIEIASYYSHNELVGVRDEVQG